jgi:hypothetical protein
MERSNSGQDLAQEAYARLFERWSDMESENHARNFAYKDPGVEFIDIGSVELKGVSRPVRLHEARGKG